MFLIQDQREKHNKHNNIENYCKEIGLLIVRKRLNVGDYRLANYDENGGIVFLNNIAVDVKGGGLLELANDLYRDKKQFNKKYKKCYFDKVNLIILIEENNIKTIKDVLIWRDGKTDINGRFLYQLIQDIKISYGVKFFVCRKKSVGSVLINLLKGIEQELVKI